MRLSLALLALACALPVAAQTSPDSVAWQRFWPDAVGNEWQYRSVCIDGFPGCSGSGARLYRYVVVGDTLIDGNRFAIISGSRIGVGEGRCAVGVRPGDLWFSVYEVPGFPMDYCSPVGEPSQWVSSYVIARDVPYAPTAVTVGPESYTAPAVFTTGIPIDSYAFAADLGLYRTAWRGGGGGQWEEAWRTTLEYAVVDGVPYGAPLVATEGDPAAAGALRLAVAPNPARERLAVTLTQAAPGSARVEVLDLLGRVVLRRDLGAQPPGAATHVLDTSALAPGVYVLRAVTPDGVVTQRFTRAD